MFIKKIKTRQSGILTYGITPPKSGTHPERISEIAANVTARLKPLAIDALIIYDVQDEAARTAVERPFPFLQAQDPYEFASEYLHDLELTKIIYRPAGKFSQDELASWLDGLQKHNFYPVFVGLPSPDFPVKTTLSQAYQVWSRYKDSSVIGAVTIPERHEVLNDEDQRILDKTRCGVSYFISQCVFNVAYAKRVICDLERACMASNSPFPTIIFTLTVCGSEKTLDFMEWLGIHIPDDLKQDFRSTENMLLRSIEVGLQIASELAELCSGKSVPFGFNIESVATRSSEVDASIHLVNKVGDILNRVGVRNKPLPTTPSTPVEVEIQAGISLKSEARI